MASKNSFSTKYVICVFYLPPGSSEAEASVLNFLESFQLIFDLGQLIYMSYCFVLKLQAITCLKNPRMNQKKANWIESQEIIGSKRWDTLTYDSKKLRSSKSIGWSYWYGISLSSFAWRYQWQNRLVQLTHFVVVIELADLYKLLQFKP